LLGRKPPEGLLRGLASDPTRRRIRAGDPTVVNHYYGNGCYDCGGWNVAGAAEVGLAAGSCPRRGQCQRSERYAYAAGGGYAMGGIYPTLPAGCVFRPMLGVYGCGGTFLKPAYGANGVYYRVVPGP